MDKDQAPLLEMKNIKKDFYGNQVLVDINLTLREGEVLGLERDYSLRIRWDDDTESLLNSGEVSVLP